MATASASANVLPDPEDYSEEMARARTLAERYRLEFIDMDEFRIGVREKRWSSSSRIRPTCR